MVPSRAQAGGRVSPTRAVWDRVIVDSRVWDVREGLGGKSGRGAKFHIQ